MIHTGSTKAKLNMTQDMTTATPDLGSLQFFAHQDTAKLLGVIAALGGEVFVLKAQIERLTRALNAAGVIDKALLEKTAASTDLQRWMSDEEKAFGRAIMRPFVHPDEAVNVSSFMGER